MSLDASPRQCVLRFRGLDTEIFFSKLANKMIQLEGEERGKGRGIRLTTTRALGLSARILNAPVAVKSGAGPHVPVCLSNVSCLCARWAGKMCHAYSVSLSGVCRLNGWTW